MQEVVQAQQTLQGAATWGLNGIITEPEQSITTIAATVFRQCWLVTFLQNSDQKHR